MIRHIHPIAIHHNIIINIIIEVMNNIVNNNNLIINILITITTKQKLQLKQLASRH